MAGRITELQTCTPQSGIGWIHRSARLSSIVGASTRPISRPKPCGLNFVLNSLPVLKMFLIMESTLGYIAPQTLSRSRTCLFQDFYKLTIVKNCLISSAWYFVGSLFRGFKLRLINGFKFTTQVRDEQIGTSYSPTAYRI